ncbi:hypothetical protein Ddc_12778 [Ditylenchus destructor]|nr:hypothetical protein Ddc_12778 [Ditylenchus destructor]
MKFQLLVSVLIAVSITLVNAGYIVIKSGGKSGVIDETIRPDRSVWDSLAAQASGHKYFWNNGWVAITAGTYWDYFVQYEKYKNTDRTKAAMYAGLMRRGRK